MNKGRNVNGESGQHRGRGQAWNGEENEEFPCHSNLAVGQIVKMGRDPD